jgi:hypothetical protein
MQYKSSIAGHPIRQSGSRYFTKLSGILLMLAFLLCSVPVSSDFGEVMCKDLKPFNNLDELLYQFYINLNSECLFKMSAAELEKIWGIKIFSDERPEKGQARYQLRMGSDFKNKPYKSEIDAFFVVMSRSRRNRDANVNEFLIEISETYYDKYGTLFPDGNYPALLPNPHIDISQKEIYPTRPGGPDESKPSRPRPPINVGKYNMTDFSYYWSSFDHTREIRLDGTRGVTRILIW